MNQIKHGNITTQKVVNGHWIAKTQTLEPLKAEIEMKGFSEANAYSKLMNFLESKEIPEKLETLENGQVYHFKKQNQ